MHFTSDNIWGASDKVMQALVKANAMGPLPSYGSDEISKDVEAAFARIFERPCSVFLATTGTAANALSIAAMTPPYAATLCHAEAHAIDDECGAPEFFMSGGKLVGIPGIGAKLTAEAIREHLAEEPGGTNHPPFRGLTLSQATECGTLYTRDEIARIADIAHEAGMKVHMDGARFANALVHLGCTASEMSWKSGIDILSFGGTKNGCLMAEAVVIFDPQLATDFHYRRKRAGQTVSKARLLAAQFSAYLDDGHWLALASHANAMAARLSQALSACPGLRLAWPTQANEVFVIMPQTTAQILRKAGATFHDWTDKSLAPDNRLQPGEVVVRLLCSFATQSADIDRLVALARANTVGSQD